MRLGTLLSRVAAPIAVLAVSAAPAGAIPPPPPNQAFADFETQMNALSPFTGVWEMAQDQSSVAISRGRNAVSIAFLKGGSVDEIVLLSFSEQRHQFEIYKPGYRNCAEGDLSRQVPCSDLVSALRFDGEGQIEWSDDAALGRHLHTVLKVSGDKLTVTRTLEPDGAPNAVTFIRQAGLRFY